MKLKRFIIFAVTIFFVFSLVGDDKKPGKLIIVMAGASGIPAENLSILTLEFQIKENIEKRYKSEFEITEVQITNDKLESLKCNYKSSSVIISP